MTACRVNTFYPEKMSYSVDVTVIPPDFVCSFGEEVPHRLDKTDAHSHKFSLYQFSLFTLENRFCYVYL